MSESALVRAVRDNIATSSLFLARVVSVEPDESAPSVAADVFVICTYGGVRAGPAHEPSGPIVDKLYDINVSIALRSPKVPRDRQAKLWVGLSSSFETFGEEIESLVDFNYDVTTAASALILAETGSTFGFQEPLKIADWGPIRDAPPEIFAGTSGASPAAKIRQLQFRGARRTVVR